MNCPETGQPLAAAAWPGHGDERVALHCPKCGKLHSFARADSSPADLAGEPASAPASA